MRNSHILKEKSRHSNAVAAEDKTEGGCREEEEKGVALPHVLHPLEEADVISTLNQQSARAVGEAPRGEKSIKCPRNDIAFLVPLFFTLRPWYSPPRPVYIPSRDSLRCAFWSCVSILARLLQALYRKVRAHLTTFRHRGSIALTTIFRVIKR